LGYQKVYQARSGCPDIHHQHGDGAAVTDEPDHYGAVDDGLEFVFLQDVQEETGKKRAGPECDHREIEEDPQPECEPVIHVGLVQPFDQAQAGCVEAETKQTGPGQHP
jgi:hypothetical protein